MPHKKRYTIEQMAQALEQTKGLQTLAALKLGCNPKVVWSYVKDSPVLQAVIKKQMEGMLDVAEGKLYAAINAGDAWAVCFFLKTKGKARGYTERSEITGKDGASLRGQPTVIVVSDQARQLTQAIVDGKRTDLALPPGKGGEG